MQRGGYNGRALLKGGTGISRIPRVTKDELREVAAGLGIDLLGVTTRERLDARVPPADRPSRISEFLDTILVLAKHVHNG